MPDISPGSSRRKLTPPQVAARYGVSADKVLGWVRSGELPAFNAATRPGGRPRWLIDVDDLADFERRRAAAPAPPPRPRQKRGSEVIRFF